MSQSPSNSETPQLLHSRLVKRSPIFYGWWVLLVGTLGLVMTMPGQSAVFSVFFDAMMADMSLSRQTITTMYSIATVAASFMLPFVGKIIDARGPRFTVVIVSIAFAASCIFMGFLRGAILLFVGFFLLRLLGQSALGIVSQHAINLWFVKRRGLAIGLSGIGFGLAVAFIPKLSEAWLLDVGWQHTYLRLGALIAVTILPLGWLVFRRQPERYGVLPDGLATTSHDMQEQPQVEETNFTLQQARRTGAFWIFLLGAMNFGGFITALQLNNDDIFTSQGLENATDVFVAFGMTAVVFNFFAGTVLDRIQPKYILMIAQSGLVACLIMSTQLTGTTSAYVYGGLMGMTQGITAALNAVVFAHYFGRVHLGSIKSFVATCSVLATAIYPLIFLTGFRWFEVSLGRYTLIAWLSALLPLTIAIIAPFLRTPVISKNTVIATDA